MGGARTPFVVPHLEGSAGFGDDWFGATAGATDVMMIGGMGGGGGQSSSPFSIEGASSLSSSSSSKKRYRLRTKRRQRKRSHNANDDDDDDDNEAGGSTEPKGAAWSLLNDANDDEDQADLAASVAVKLKAKKENEGEQQQQQQQQPALDHGEMPPPSPDRAPSFGRASSGFNPFGSVSSDIERLGDDSSTRRSSTSNNFKVSFSKNPFGNGMGGGDASAAVATATSPFDSGFGEGDVGEGGSGSIVGSDANPFGGGSTFLAAAHEEGSNVGDTPVEFGQEGLAGENKHEQIDQKASIHSSRPEARQRQQRRSGSNYYDIAQLRAIIYEKVQ
eukprot:jgi/Bigna1/130337/aug1.11_g5045